MTIAILAPSGKRPTPSRAEQATKQLHRREDCFRDRMSLGMSVGVRLLLDNVTKR